MTNNDVDNLEFRTFSLLLDCAFATHPTEDVVVKRDGVLLPTRAVLLAHDDGEKTQLVIKGGPNDTAKLILHMMATSPEFASIVVNCAVEFSHVILGGLLARSK